MQVFDGFPQTFSEFQELALERMETPEGTAALFVLALEAMIQFDKREAVAMVNLLRGPKPLSAYDESFLNDRICDKSWLARAYFVGSTPENDYQPSLPLSLEFTRASLPSEPDFCKLFIKTPAFDTPRSITLRCKDTEPDKWYLWEYSSLLLDVRQPLSADPWHSF